MKGKTDCGGPKKNYLDRINKPTRGKSLSPYDNPDRTANWLYKQILGNISGASEKSQLNDEKVLQIAKAAVEEAEKEVTNQ